MRARSLIFGSILAALPAACSLNLDGLTGGTTTAASGGASSSSSSSGSAPPDAGSPLFDCSSAADPVVLAQGSTVASLPRGIVAGADAIYWVNLQAGNVMRLASSGGPPTAIATAASPRGIALSGDTLAWTAADGVYTCALPACAAPKKSAAALGSGTLRAVAFDGQRLVFTDRAGGPNDGRARACDVAACAPIDLAEGMIAPEGVALAIGVAYWLEQGNGNANGSVHQSPAGSASASQITAALDLPQAVAVDDTYAYWTEQGRVARCPITGGYCDNPEDIAPAAGPLGSPGDLQVAAGRITWADTGDGTILSCPQPGCGATQPRVHVTGRTGLVKIAVTESCLFWAEDAGGGAVLKVAR